jgi:AcrR family transcriptional regulator
MTSKRSRAVVEMPATVPAAGVDARASRYDEKQQAILRAATIAFNKKGVRGANLTEIARAVGLTTASITYYYKRKEQLAAACFLEGIATYNELIRANAAHPHAADRLASLVLALFQLWHDVALDRREWPMLFDDIRTLSGEVVRPVGEAYQQMFLRLRKLLFGDLAADELSSVNRNARSHLALQCLLWLPAWLAERDPHDYRFDAAHFSDLLINGFARAGWKPDPDARAVVIVPRMSEPREAFLSAATFLINAHGYHGASVDKISARLNVSKGSFYHHHETKDELVLACFERTLSILHQVQSEGRALAASGLDRLRAVCAALTAFQVSESGPLLRSTALLALPESARQPMIVRMNQVSGRFADMITDGIIDGSIRPINAKIGGQLVNPMINGAASLQRWAPGLGAESAADIYVDPLLRGLLVT